jgi:hypothetical protein
MCDAEDTRSQPVQSPSANSSTCCRQCRPLPRTGSGHSGWLQSTSTSGISGIVEGALCVRLSLPDPSVPHRRVGAPPDPLKPRRRLVDMNSDDLQCFAPRPCSQGSGECTESSVAVFLRHLKVPGGLASSSFRAPRSGVGQKLTLQLTDVDRRHTHCHRAEWIHTAPEHL